MKNKFKEIIKSLEGKVLVIGFSKESKELKEMEKNKRVIDYIHLSDETEKNSKGRRKIFGNKTIKIKRMYKDLKKEKFDYILVDFKVIKKYLDSFIYNSFKLTNNKIYFILDDEIYNYEELMYRYNRYNAITSSISYKDEYIVTIDLKNIKINIVKRFIYSVRDIFYDALELIASIIIS